MKKKEWLWMDKLSGENHHYNEGKEYLKRPKISDEDAKYRQGRSKHRVEATEKFAAWTIMAFIIIVGVLLILGQFV